jgi:hypothetical protein
MIYKFLAKIENIIDFIGKIEGSIYVYLFYLVFCNY